MPNDAQVALAEGAAVLEETHGESFTFSAATFQAWPVQLFEVRPGRLVSAPDSTKTYEAIHATAPAFVNGSILTTAAGAKRVGVRHLPDPTTGLFRFTIP